MMISELKKLAVKLVYLYIGFAFIALGAALTIKANIGVSPWDVLHQGLAQSLDISIGFSQILVGIVVIIITAMFKSYPGFGTVLNIISIGLFLDLFMAIVPKPETALLVYLAFFLGLIALALGATLYLKASFGAGPRDSLLLAIIRKFQISTTYIKPIIEGIVIVLGILLGGNFGIGTIVILLTVGFFMDIFFKLLRFNPKQEIQLDFMDQIKYLKGMFSYEDTRS